MPEFNNEKPLTVKDVHEVLIPAMEGVFATKKDLERYATKQELGEVAAELSGKIEGSRIKVEQELAEKFNRVLNGQDRIIKDLDMLKTEATMGNYLRKKEQRFRAIVTGAMKEHDILSPQQSKEIDQLAVF